MIAVLLCAGFGTRLQPVTKEMPKALVPVAGRPVLDYLIDQLVTWHALDVIHVVHNDRRPAAFVAWQERWSARLDNRYCKIRIHDNGVRTEAERRGAVGDLQWILDRVGTDQPAVVSGGDSIYRCSLQPVADRYSATGRSCVLALRPADPGEVAHSSVLDVDGTRVQRIVHASDDSPSLWISPSFYVLQSADLEAVEPYLDQGGAADSLGHLIDYVARHRRVDACKIEAPDTSRIRFHINTPEQYRRANQRLRDEPLKIDC